MSGVPKRVIEARMGRFNRQTGIKLQGDANRVDLSRMARRAIKRRVHTTFKVKGYNSDYRCDHGIDPNTASKEAIETHCYNTNEPGTVLLEPAPVTQAAAGGVGHINHPRRRCNYKCSKLPEPYVPPPAAHCNHVLELDSHVDPIKRVNKESGDITYDQSFCKVKFTWVRPAVWDEIGTNEKYNYLNVEFLEIRIMKKGIKTPLEIGYPTVNNNSYTCKASLQYNTNYTAEVINHCCCGVGTATINFPTGVAPSNPHPQSTCSTLTPCNNDDPVFWYGTINTQPINYIKDDKSHGWGAKFFSTADYFKNHLRYANCIDHWTFQIFKENTSTPIDLTQSTGDPVDNNNTGKIMNTDKDFSVFLYSSKYSTSTSNNNIFFSKDISQNTTYDLIITAIVKRGTNTNCKPSPTARIKIKTGKDNTPPPPPPPPNPCGKLSKTPETDWIGVITTKPINPKENNPQSFGIGIYWNTDSIKNNNCTQYYVITLKDVSGNTIYNYTDSSGYLPNQIIVTQELLAPNLLQNTTYTLTYEAVPVSNSNVKGIISAQISATSGGSPCNVNNFIGPITTTTINAPKPGSDAYGLKVQIDDSNLTPYYLNMLTKYSVKLYRSPKNTYPTSLLSKDISVVSKSSKVDILEFLKDCTAPCYEYSGMLQNTDYDVEITGVFDNQITNIDASKLGNPYYLDFINTNTFRVIDSDDSIHLPYAPSSPGDDYYKDFNKQFNTDPEMLDSITHGRTVQYIFKVNKYNLTSADESAGDNIISNPYFNTVWVGMVDSGYDKRATKVKEIDGSVTSNVGVDKRLFLQVAVSITYNPVPPIKYDIWMYNMIGDTITPDQNITIPISDPNNLPEFAIELGEVVNGEVPVNFIYNGTSKTFSNKLKNISTDAYYFAGTFGSKGVIMEDLQFNPLVTTCSPPVKTVTVRSGKIPSTPTPPPPTPTPTPTPTPPIYSKVMPQLYLTTYGNSSFLLGKFIDDSNILSQILKARSDINAAVTLSDKVTQIKWYIIREFNSNYFKGLENFIVDSDNNFKNFMILIGDYLPLLPPIVMTNTAKDTIVVPSCSASTNVTGYGYQVQPYPLNAINGPVDFGLKYNTKTPESFNVAKDISGVVSRIGCSLILDHIIPLAVRNKNENKPTNGIEITVNSDITLNDQAWITWDAGNYVRKKYNGKFPIINGDPNSGYTVSHPEFKCGTKIPTELAYFVVRPENFNESSFASDVSNSKLGKIVISEFTILNGTTSPDGSIITFEEATLTNGSYDPLHMFCQFDVNLPKIRFKKFNTTTDPRSIRVDSYDPATKKVTFNQKVTYNTTIDPTTPKVLIFSYYSPDGNTFIGDGSGLDASKNRITPGYGCGRSTHFKAPATANDYPELVDISNVDMSNNFYNYGDSNGNNLKDLVYGLNSFPIDNLHQYFITVYFINQKIMELNYHISIGNLQFATTAAKPWGKDDLLPLITHVHSDRESASPYAGSLGPYPSCDASGNLLKGESIGGAKGHTGLGDFVSVGYWKYLYNKYMPAECLPLWRRSLDPNLTNQPTNTIMKVPITQGGPNGIKVPNTNEILWDTSKAWNIHQRRNFHQDASSNVNRGYAITSNNLHSVKKGSSYDGIQRYQTGWINTQTTAFLKNSGEGLLEPWQEIYNIGEVKPPLVAGGTLEGNSFAKIIQTQKGKNEFELDISYGKLFRLPDKNSIDASKNIIIQNSIGTFGSGFIPGTSFPKDAGNVGIGTNLPPQLAFRLNSINNSLIGRIAKKYGTNVSDFIGATSIKGLEDYRSPALTDLWLRETGDGTTTSLPAIPIDGRGFKKLSDISNATVDNVSSGGLTRSEIVNLSKNTDGYYLPIDASFCDLSTGKINLSSIYDSSDLNTKFWGTQNSATPGSGPQEAIATFSFEYQGGAMGIDPRIQGMPGGINDSIKSGPWSDTQINKFKDGALAFTGKSRTYTTKMYGDTGSTYINNDHITNVFNTGSEDYSDAITNLFKTGNNLYMVPDCSASTCTVTDLSSAKALAFSGLSSDTLNSQYNNSDPTYGIPYGWTPASYKLGGETNILSALGVDNFTNMRNFIKAAATCVGGKDNIGKIKIGLYTQEYLPVTWMRGSKDVEI